MSLFCWSLTAHASEPVVVVLDPGHGGEQDGAIHGSFIEKEMNLIVAKAMKEELEKYEGITVYLTREDNDTTVSIKQRAKLAADVGADFLYSLHFNTSANHNLFGAEVWVSAHGGYYARGHAFGQIQMAAFRDLGLFDRGVKTRLSNTNSNSDYYGIIRESRALGVTAVLIEHCHLDHFFDQPFYTMGTFQLEEFGRINATSVAKYFRLKSAVLAVDYSDYEVPEVERPKAVVRPDYSPPDVAVIELVSLDREAGEAEILLIAEDKDSRVLYYTVSTSAGRDFAYLQPFPSDSNEVTISVNAPPDQDIRVVVAVFNAYDQTTLSNTVDIAALPHDLLAEYQTVEKPVAEPVEEPAVAEPEQPEEQEIDIALIELLQKMFGYEDYEEIDQKGYSLVIAALVAVMILVVLILASRVYLYQKLVRSRPLMKRFRDFCNFLFTKKPKAKSEEEAEAEAEEEEETEEEKP
ncbi:MAG: N-acetylmuramoyl-L-alanine amidase [Lachnospiraceae bacterium]|nr:N-acetylmuramoyl-L-alanine amidase [Lachnospiraceae bacterium]